MNILWFLEKNFDVSLSRSARIATIKYLEKGHDILIVTNFRRQRIYDSLFKSKIIYLNKIDFPFVRTLSLYHQHIKFLDRVDLKKIDIVLVNSSNPYLMRKLFKLRKQYRFRIILDIRTLPVDTNFFIKEKNEFLFERSIKIAAKNFDGITYITEEMKKYCTNKYKLPDHRSAVWSSGVDTDLFKPADQHRDGQAFRLMYHGVITKNRGIKNVVKALELLQEQDIEFLLLGSGKESCRLKKLVKKIGLEDKVFFYENVSHEQVPKFINGIDAGIVPLPRFAAWNVSSPIKVFEYLACGKPVVVTKIPAHISIFNGKSFAFWAENSSPSAVAKAILDAQKSKGDFKKLGLEARDFVGKNFTWERQISKLETFLRGV